MHYILAILDSEELYAKRLTEFLNHQEDPVFFAQAFTSFQSLQEFAQKHTIKVLLLHTGCWNEEIMDLKAERIVFLSDGIVPAEFPKLPVLYKYQAADSLLLALLNCCADMRIGRTRAKGMAAEVLTVYSPVKQSVNTCFAVVMGMELAKNKRVLYLSLEPFSAFPGFYETVNHHNLSDLMYFLKQENDEVYGELKNSVFKIRNLDCVMSAQAPLDIQSFSKEDWEQLLTVLKENAGYEVLVLEFGEEVRGFMDLLNKSDFVYLPVKNEIWEGEKIRQLEAFLEKAGYQELKQRMRKLTLPSVKFPTQKEYYFEQLEAGVFGEFVREVRKQDEL